MIGFTSSVAMLLAVTATGGMGLPFGVPPGPEDPAIARALPGRCIFCVSWAGTASPDAKSRNQTEQLLAEPEVQNFLAQVGPAICATVKSNFQSDDPKSRVVPDELVDVEMSIPQHAGAIFVSPTPKTAAGQKGKASSLLKMAGNMLPHQFVERLAAQGVASFDAGMVVALGDDAPRLRAALQKWRAARDSNARKATNTKSPSQGGKKKGEVSKGDANNAAPLSRIEEVTIGGCPWYHLAGWLDQPITFGLHGEYLIVATGDTAIEEIIGRMKGKPPAWWSKIQDELPIERRSVVAYVNFRLVKEIVSAGYGPVPSKGTAPLSLAQKSGQSPGYSDHKAETSAAMEVLGLSNATALIEVWGLEGEDFANKTLLALDGEPRGLLRLVCDRPLRLEELSPIPRDAAFAAAFHLDARQAVDMVWSTMTNVRPAVAQEASAAAGPSEQNAGFAALQRLLKSLGTSWCVYNSPSENGLVPTGLTAVAPVHDGAGLDGARGLREAVGKNRPRRIPAYRAVQVCRPRRVLPQYGSLCPGLVHHQERSRVLAIAAKRQGVPRAERAP